MKKKLLFSPFSRQWNSLVAKFYRLYKRINSTQFVDIYSIEQQRSLLNKLQNLYRRLEKIQHNVGIKLAGTAVALMFTSAVSFGQTNYVFADSIQVRGFHVHKAFPKPAFADLDNGGNLDLFIGDGGNIRVYQNDGTGNFPGDSTLLQADGADINVTYWASPAFADIDKDGDLDLVVGYYGYIEMFRNNAGTFNSEGNLQADGSDINPGDYVAPAFADLDGDGDMDLFVGAKDGKIYKYLNNGAGVFTADGEIMAGGTEFVASNYAAPAFADMDKDGDLDLYVGEGNTGGILLLKNNGDGTFAAPEALKVGGVDLNVGLYATPAFADLDGDGTKELYTGFYVKDNSVPNGLLKFELDLSTAVEKSNSSNFSVYPNPAKEILHINGVQVDATVRISNILGRTIAEYRHVRDRIDISELSEGIYFIKIVDGKKTITQKFIKK